MRYFSTACRQRQYKAILLFFAVFLSVMFPFRASAQTSGKVVRVGWYESSFNHMDTTGRRSGYAYEYQLKIGAYTGWTYQYIKGSWPELLSMLEAGEIDLMSDVSYTPEREERMLFPSLPMGTEEYYLFISPGNREIKADAPETLNGKKVGVNRGSIQEDYYLEWAKKNNVQAELAEQTCGTEESMAMLENGKLDAFVTVDSFINTDLAVPVYKIGSSDFFFAVNKERPDLLEDLNFAMNRLQDENRYYNQQMFDKFFKRTGANVFLSEDEVNWLSQHRTIRVGYQDHILALCASDKETGELTGALKDYLKYASQCVANLHPEFEAIAYPTIASAMEAMNKGEIDCVFPANLNGYDGEQLGVVLTPPLIDSEVFAVVKSSVQSFFPKKEHVIVAVDEDNLNYETFLADHYPDWRRVYFSDTESCLKAVSDGVADCVLISNYRYNNLLRLIERYHLATLTTGIGSEYCIAVDKATPELYSILSKVVSLIPNSSVNAALTYYISEDSKVTLTDFLIDNLAVILTVFLIVLIAILFLMIKSMRAEKRANKLILATETDELTGLYNRDFFFQYAYRLFRGHSDGQMDAIVLNIEQFHTVNALNGRDFGDHVLRTLGKEIHQIADDFRGIAGRFEADRFDIYCRHCSEDELQKLYDRLQEKLDGLSKNGNLRLRMGVMPWQKGMEPVQQFDMARTACSMARGHYKEHLIIFNEKVRDREDYEQRLQHDLRRGLDSFEFEVYYQPKYDIQSDPPKLVSAEALVRWFHPELGMIPPGDFIPLFEKNGQISLIDKYVWAEAAKQVIKWKDLYGVSIPVSVNLSRVDIFDPLLEETLDQILRYNRLNHQSFKLEVTESAYTENADQVIKVVESLRRKGYEVEMDDFGTGYSSLSMLSAMPIDVLKMDRAFIQNMEHNEKDIQLVALILGIARNLKIPVVAEGVETEEQVNLLKNLGCAIVQGYYFSRPLRPSEFEEKYIKNYK